MAKKVLIIDEVHPSLAKELRSLGFEVDEQSAIHPKDVSLTNYQGLVLRSKMPLGAKELENTRLEFIARAGAGLDLIDLEFCQANQIAVFSANEGNHNSPKDQYSRRGGPFRDLESRGKSGLGITRKDIRYHWLWQHGSKSCQEIARFRHEYPCIR
jgi:hypothetical protein